MASIEATSASRKRRRLEKTPIEVANEKTDKDFIKDYLHESSGESALFSKWVHPRTKQEYSISLLGAGSMLTADLLACFALVEETSRPDYEASSGGWKPTAKKREMRAPELRYILVKDLSGYIKGFTSLMPTYEQGQPVIYCYEIHLQEDLRGTGLAAQLMSLHEIIACNLPTVEKVMLTCFVSNGKAFHFYEALGYQRDDVTPDAKTLRSGETRAVDYVIMSKSVGRGTGAGPDSPSSLVKKKSKIIERKSDCSRKSPSVNN